MRQGDDQEPPLVELVRDGAARWAALEREAAALGAALGEKLADHAHGLAGTGRVLDFGAGSGGTARAVGAVLAGTPSDACEADAAALAELGRTLPAVRATAAGATPPLPFEDAAFGAVYAAGAFMHLPPSLALAFLGEFARILVEDGVALIAVVGPGGVDRRRAAHRPGWIGVGEADLGRTGALHLPLGARAGGGTFGLTAYSHAHLVAAWDPILAIEAIYEAAGPDGEDLVVLRKITRRRTAAAQGPVQRLGQALKGAWKRRFG